MGQGSMYPNSIHFGLKVVPIWVLRGQSIYYLGTWTLRVGVLVMGLGALGVLRCFTVRIEFRF